MALPPYDVQERHMRLAIEAARKGWGRTHPNPLVGAVVARGETVLAVAHHEKAGEPHAEMQALRQCPQPLPVDAVLYVTLEPCSTVGRTPACTDGIIAAGIRHVVVGTVDLNPKHRGRGLHVLRQGGVTVQSGVCEEACADLNLLFNHAMVYDRPLWAGKIACTLDGKVATRGGHSQWITSSTAREEAMWWRQLFPVIAVGSGTVTTDNPRLTVRRTGQPETAPRRLVFDRTGETLSLPARHLYADAFAERTVLVASPQIAADRLEAARGQGLEVWIDDPDDPSALDQQLRAEGCTGVLVEGGPRLLSALLRQRRLDYLFVYTAPRFFADAAATAALDGFAPGRIEEGFSLARVRRMELGNDLLTRGHLEYPETARDA